MPPLTRENLDRLRTEPVPLVFSSRCHPDAGASVAYVGDGVIRVGCGECDTLVMEFAVAGDTHRLIEEEAGEPVCKECGWAMSDHGDPPMCPPVPETTPEGGSRR